MGRSIVVLEGVAFEYSKGSQLFSGLNASFLSGRTYALVGPSGCGKSTLLYLLGLMLLPSLGDVVFGGVSMGRAAETDRARTRAAQIGFVFQDAILDGQRSVLNAVMEPALYGRHIRDSGQALAKLEHLGLLDVSDRRCSTLSGGQAQRVGLARALAGDPQLILADEPTGNLDDENARAVTESLAAFVRSGGCAIIATHDPRIAEVCDEEIRVGLL